MEVSQNLQENVEKMVARNQLIAAWKWKKLPVLDDGFVCLVDVMGDDQAVVQAARVSYGVGTKTARDDEGLIRYMMRHRHTSPFEQAELKFLVRVPMDCWRQWIRHRTANVNEYSTRFSEAIDSAATTEPDEWRSQGKKNRQGSGDGEIKWPEGYYVRKKIHDGMTISDVEKCQNYSVCRTTEDGREDLLCGFNGFDHEPTPQEFLTHEEKVGQYDARKMYEERLAFGVAREQARKDLPLSTMTEAYWKCDLHNILHFLGLRMDSHAQKEIREYANRIGEIVAALFPVTWQAFKDFRLEGMSLSGLEVEAMRSINALPDESRRNLVAINSIAGNVFGDKKSEKEEFLEKAKKLWFFE